MNFLTKAFILYDAYRNRKYIEKTHTKMKDISIAKWVSLIDVQPKQGEYPLTPNYQSELKKRIDWIDSYKMSGVSNHTLLIGDSLSDFTRKYLTSVDTRFNLALAGQGSSFYDSILRDTFSYLQGVNIDYLIIECFGNELLSYFDVQVVKEHASRTFKLARGLYPNAKIILGGLPPVYDVYVNTVKIEFTNHLLTLVNNDSNSCLVLLEKHFAGTFGIFPKIDYSSDGVHFTGQGIIDYDNLLNQAKITTEKVIGY